MKRRFDWDLASDTDALQMWQAAAALHFCIRRHVAGTMTVLRCAGRN